MISTVLEGKDDVLKASAPVGPWQSPILPLGSPCPGGWGGAKPNINTIGRMLEHLFCLRGGVNCAKRH